ncbi:hypothetical protein EV426DRAFT_228967 [Tirmania nivea]|nr:hypothetical protein EV426DRAFT_228967 [Tirmania nivea]
MHPSFINSTRQGTGMNTGINACFSVRYFLAVLCIFADTCFIVSVLLSLLIIRGRVGSQVAWPWPCPVFLVLLNSTGIYLILRLGFRPIATLFFSHHNYSRPLSSSHVQVHQCCNINYKQV